MAENRSPVILPFRYHGKDRVVLEYLVYMEPSYLNWFVHRSKFNCPHFVRARGRWLLKELGTLKPVGFCPICHQREITTAVFKVTLDHLMHRCFFPLENICDNPACLDQLKDGLDAGTIIVCHPATYETAYIFKPKAAQERWARAFLKLCGFDGKLSPQGILNFLDEVSFPIS